MALYYNVYSGADAIHIWIKKTEIVFVASPHFNLKLH